MAGGNSEARSDLRSLGLFVTPEWCRAAEEQSQQIDPAWAGASREHKLDLLVARFLECNLAEAAEGSLPADLEELHGQTLQGRHVLQLDEAVDISKPVKERYTDEGAAAGRGRCLKMALTDGVQRVSAMEYRPIPALGPGAPAGLKLAVTDAMIRRGVLLLRPENVEVLGGKVDRLERARQALWQHCNRPLSARAAADRGGALEAMRRAAWAWQEGGEAAAEEGLRQRPQEEGRAAPAAARAEVVRAPPPVPNPGTRPQAPQRQERPQEQQIQAPPQRAQGVPRERRPGPQEFGAAEPREHAGARTSSSGDSARSGAEHPRSAPVQRSGGVAAQGSAGPSLPTQQQQQQQWPPARRHALQADHHQQSAAPSASLGMPQQPPAQCRSKLSLSLSQRPGAAAARGPGVLPSSAAAPSARTAGCALDDPAAHLLPSKRPLSGQQIPRARDAPVPRLSDSSSSRFLLDDSESDLDVAAVGPQPTPSGTGSQWPRHQNPSSAPSQAALSPMELSARSATPPDGLLPSSGGSHLSAPRGRSQPQQPAVSPVPALAAMRTPMHPSLALRSAPFLSATARSHGSNPALSTNPATPATAGGAPFPCLRGFTEMQAKMQADQRPLRPKPIHAVLSGTDGKLVCKDDYGNPLDAFKLAVFLDDGTARRRCLVDSRLVERWLGGKRPADIAPYNDNDPRRAELLAPVRSLLQKAEGMWTLEIRGGGADVAPVITNMEPGIDRATVEKLRRSCLQLYPNVAATDAAK